MATGKKAAPAKKTAAKTAVKKTAVKRAATPATAKKAEPSQREPSHQEIAALAAKYWAERGHHYHDGQAEQDWLRAERELRGH